MSPQRPVRELTVELPASAPLVRITAGLGSAGQKTWNLRRPVTLIGAKRPAHIVLHGSGISNAHCAIVNTGGEVLLKDLSTSGGTRLNGQRISLLPLNDGDLLQIGETQIQVAIRLPDGRPDDSGCGMRYDDMTTFAEPVRVQLAYTDMIWTVTSSVVLIGKHQRAEIRLEHDDIASRHAVIFRFREGPAIFDITDGAGLLVNDERASLTPLQNADRIKIGPFTLVVGQGDPIPEQDEPAAAAAGPPESGHAVESGGSPPPVSQPIGDAPGTLSAEPDPPDPLSGSIHESWEELNARPPGASEADPAVAQQLEDLRAREAELDARDAVLRGKLHDVTRFHEQVLERERDLGAMAARLQAEADELANAKKSFEAVNAKLEQKVKDVQRREQALAQRWSRMQSLSCPNCGNLVNLAKGE